MKSFAIDGQLEELLDKMTEKFGYKDIRQTLHKGFLFLQLLNVLKEEGGKLLYQDPNGDLLPLDIFDPDHLEDIEKSIK